MSTAEHPSILTLSPLTAREPQQLPIGNAAIDARSRDGAGALARGKLTMLAGKHHAGRTTAALTAAVAAARASLAEGTGPVLVLTVEERARYVVDRLIHLGADDATLAHIRVAETFSAADVVAVVAKVCADAVRGLRWDQMHHVVPSAVIIDDAGMLAYSEASRLDIDRRKAEHRVARALFDLAAGNVGAAFTAVTGLRMADMYGMPWMDATPIAVLATLRRGRDSDTSLLGLGSYVTLASLVCEVTDEGKTLTVLKSHSLAPKA